MGLDLLGILWTHGLKKHAPEQDLVQAARVLWWLLNEEDVPPTGDRELLNGSSRDRLFQDILLAALAYQDISDVRVVYGDWEVVDDFPSGPFCPAFRLLRRGVDYKLVIRGTSTVDDNVTNFTSEYDQLDGVQCHKGYALAARVVIAVMTDRNPTAFERIRRGSHSLVITGHSLGGAVAALIHMFLSVEPEPVPVLYSLGIGSAPCIAPASAQKACEALKYKHVSLCRQHDPIWLASPAQMRDLFVRAVELKLEHNRESLCLHKMQNKEQSVLAREARRLEKSLADMLQRGTTAQQYVPAGQILLMTDQQALLRLDPGQLPKLTIQIDKLHAQRAHPGTGIAGHAHSLIAYVESLRNVPISLPGCAS